MSNVKVEKSGQVYFIRFSDGSKAWLAFKEENGKLYLIETYTPEQHRGKGYASKLVEAAIEDAEKRNLKIVPICSYSVHYFIKNKEKRRLLDEPYASMSEEELQNYYRERLNAERSKH